MGDCGLQWPITCARGPTQRSGPALHVDRGRPRGTRPGRCDLVTGRLVTGLLARRRAEAEPSAIVSCDNLPDNGLMARGVVLDLADAVDYSLRGWIDENVAWVATMVDRITPRASQQDQADLTASTSIEDPACVVTEPFYEWVLHGDFPAGRPAWEDAGARFVDDIAPYERRKRATSRCPPRKFWTTGRLYFGAMPTQYPTLARTDRCRWSPKDPRAHPARAARSGGDWRRRNCHGASVGRVDRAR